MGALTLIPYPIAHNISYLLMVPDDTRPRPGPPDLGRCDKSLDGEVLWEFEVKILKIIGMLSLTPSNSSLANEPEVDTLTGNSNLT